jgi:hypothetical protein
VDGPTFLGHFAPALDAASLQKAIASLPQKTPPAITVATAPSGPDTQVTLTITDPAGVMLVPPAVTVVDAAGTATTTSLTVGAPVQVVVPAGGYIAPDEGDVHPHWRTSFTITSADYYGKLVPLFLPTAAGALTAYETRSASHQERAAGDKSVLTLMSAQFMGFHDVLDSVTARRVDELDVCSTLRSLNGGGDTAGWQNAITPYLTTPATTAFGSRYSGCGVTLAASVLGAEFGALAAAAPTLSAASAPRAVYLMSFDYGSTESMRVMSAITTQAPSLQLREQALSRLSLQAAGGYGYSAVAAGDIPTWKTFFRARLADVTSATRLSIIWRAVVGLNDDGALALVAPELHAVRMSAAFQAQIVCDAYAVAQAVRPAAFGEFVAAAQPTNTLSADAQAAIADPTTNCP